ncbi:hypothetical protein P153DRAFT_388904 [Dothidotthia symphoricarpi CBS 119687]|uniref:Transcription factor Iwr1 domain-containing protein n=1 Tax=Dothidotthia symphoricarpi CBS 119687 TaxID=1392245 RepID=A0A6A6A5V7_9PLEO|nr:uncharacterized protein P153DRAFT_388904 [Dothidotthia symphoricarpi CBS 119687]KAF2126158.1 hypothetical protein P153DRAFT_388904 [Dothidotthia symphoricarpi CBS 119687]
MPAPTTLRVKRKRDDAPVDALLVKRQKALEADPKALRQKFYFRRLTRPNDAPATPASPTPASERRFHLDASAGNRTNHVFIEARPAAPGQPDSVDGQLQVPVPEPAHPATPRPRKRPGTKSALPRTPATAIQQKSILTSPSAQDLRELEALSEQLGSPTKNATSPSKYKPKAPARRFAERHPEQAPQHGDAMELDTDEYVYDTYVREAIMPDAPEPSGTVGFLVINEADEEFWYGDDESDREFDTDDEDENAEDYYANDYPEDEMSEDDEFGRDLYQKKYRIGSDEEDYNPDDDDDAAIGSGEDEDDLHYKMTVPKAQRVGYWGTYGEK